MFTKINRIMILLFVITLFLSACMPSKFQEEIEETEKKNSEVKKEKEKEEVTPENVELSKEQKEALDELEDKSNEEALFENDLDIRKELNIQVPEKRSSYENPEELSQYISYLFFAYHKGEMKPETFVDELLPHAHEEFLKLLPTNQKNQIETFTVLQETNLKALPSPIASYVITDIQYQERAGEAMFYRKYVLQNIEEIYYITTIKKEDNVWKLFDDSPAPPYEVAPIMNNQQ
jgi:Na+-transporting methylmalonyl-CoA/oxaloacetate decarboxylase gamma subunit